MFVCILFFVVFFNFGNEGFSVCVCVCECVFLFFNFYVLVLLSLIRCYYLPLFHGKPLLVMKAVSVTSIKLRSFEKPCTHPNAD